MRGIIRLLTCCFILIFWYFANAWSAPTCNRSYTSCLESRWNNNGFCNDCPTAYPNSVSGATDISACYLLTTAGNYVATAGACGPTACASGLTTIGYGTGADEAGDCGRKLHLGEYVVFLRSSQKTTPSLKFDTNNDGATDLFGNMSTTPHLMSDGVTESYKVTYNGLTYYIYDDSVQ